MAIDDKYINRNFIPNYTGKEGDDVSTARRALSDSLLNPNVVRIQLLDGAKVLRYLGSLERLGYENVRVPLMEQINIPQSEKVFYGILKNGIDQSWELTGDWSKPQGGGGLLGMVKQLASKVPVIGSGIDIVEGAVKFGERVTGTNTTATGSSTMKQYGGASLKSPSVTVSWYLPEQYGMCVRGLQTLTRMVYARDIGSEEDFKTNLSNIASNIISESLTQAETFASSAAASLIPGAGGNDKKDKQPSATISAVSETLGSALGSGMGGIFTVNDVFGKNLTFDPVPVRLCVGQYIDIEPLVITSLKITFSKEQFLSGASINAIPLHLPLFCTAEITFDFWVNPSPSMQFMKILGLEMFGPPRDGQDISTLITTELNNKEKGSV